MSGILNKESLREGVRLRRIRDSGMSRPEIRLRCLEALAGSNGIEKANMDLGHLVRAVDFLEAVVVDTVDRDVLKDDA